MAPSSRRVIAAAIVVAALVATPAAAAWPGKPRAASPRPPAAGGPPPAWIETQARSLWLAFGGYCWRRTCVTTIPPAQRADIPTLRVRSGSIVRVHLGFDAARATVHVGLVAVAARRSGRLITWKATRSGLVYVSAAAAGSASFLVRLRLS